MENMLTVIPRETTELLRENNQLRQRVRALEEQAAEREQRVAALESELRIKNPIVHKWFARHREGQDRSRWHEELRADILTAGQVAVILFAVAYVAQTIFWRVTGMGA